MPARRASSAIKSLAAWLAFVFSAAVLSPSSPLGVLSVETILAVLFAVPDSGRTLLAEAAVRVVAKKAEIISL